MSPGGTPPAVAVRPLCVQAIPAITAPAVPRIAPGRPSAAAVAAVIVRRVALLAPAAVSVRRSGAVSLRIRPAEAASTLSAIATAHLDSESEVAMQRALATALAGRTSLVIAHRLSMVRAADHILVVDGGQIAERGTHDELLAASGVYAGLYRTQFAPQAALRSFPEERSWS
jgi:hypothetical protein